jgi:hypothetical protein
MVRIDQFADINYNQRVKHLVIDHATSGDNELLAGVAGEKIRVYNIVLISSGTTTVRFESGAGGTALSGQLSLVANVGFAPGHDPNGHFETAAGQALNLELSAAVSVDGWLTYAYIENN